MSFSGQIEDFPVIDIMQYVHASCKSGTLHFQNGSQAGRVHFRDGQIIRVAKPEMTNLGDLIRKRGLISLEDLQAAVRIQKDALRPRPLGRILEEMGAITHAMLREAMIAQFEEVIYDLVGWKEGSFRFELAAEEPPDDISATPDDLIPPEEIDTQFLLMEAVRIFDETGDRGGGLSRLGPDQGRIQTPTAAADRAAGASGEAESPAGPAKDERSGFFLLKKMLLEGRRSERSQFISGYLLKILSEHLERAILFLVRRSELLALGAFGQTRDERSLHQEIGRWRMPLDPDSLLGRCLEARSPFQGTAPIQPWLQMLHRKIGAPRTPEVVILPVAGVDRVICLVYGDQGSCSRPACNLEILEITAALTGLIFENTFLRKQLQRESH